MGGPWLEPYSSKKFYLYEPEKYEYDIEEIAHVLSLQCRFGGHIKFFYSVALHSVYVSRIVSEEFALAALLHDASEAYIQDIITPLKRIPEFKEYRIIEDRVQKAIYDYFKISYNEDQIIAPEIKQADEIMLVTERQCLKKESDNDWAVQATPLDEDSMNFYNIDLYTPTYPNMASKEFLDRYYELTRE